MKKNIFVLIAALCAVNGAWAIITHPTTVRNASWKAIRVTGAAGTHWVIEKPKLLPPTVSTRELAKLSAEGWIKTDREGRNYLIQSRKFETGVRDTLTIQIGTYIPQLKKFEAASGRNTYTYDLWRIKGHFNWVEDVWFVGDDTLKLRGVLKSHTGETQQTDGNKYYADLKGYCDNGSYQPCKTEERIPGSRHATVSGIAPKSITEGRGL